MVSSYLLAHGRAINPPVELTRRIGWLKIKARQHGRGKQQSTENAATGHALFLERPVTASLVSTITATGSVTAGPRYPSSYEHRQSDG
jgi:hypothetical protein